MYWIVYVYFIICRGIEEEDEEEEMDEVKF